MNSTPDKEALTAKRFAINVVLLKELKDADNWHDVNKIISAIYHVRVVWNSWVRRKNSDLSLTQMEEPDADRG